MGLDRYPVWKKRVFFITVFLTVMGIIINSRLTLSPLLFGFDFFIFTALFLSYLFFLIYDIVYFLHDLENDEKAAKIGLNHGYDITFFIERKKSKRKYISSSIFEGLGVLVVLGFLWLINPILSLIILFG